MSEEFKCSVCGGTFPSEELLNEHMKNAHGDRTEGVLSDI
jgi:hypothetical protein